MSYSYWQSSEPSCYQLLLVKLQAKAELKSLDSLHSKHYRDCSEKMRVKTEFLGLLGNCCLSSLDCKRLLHSCKNFGFRKLILVPD